MLLNLDYVSSSYIRTCINQLLSWAALYCKALTISQSSPADTSIAVLTASSCCEWESSGSLREVASQLQGAGTEPELYPWPLCANSKWAAEKGTMQKKKKKSPNPPTDSKQLLLQQLKMAVSLSHSCKGLNFSKVMVIMLYTYTNTRTVGPKEKESTECIQPHLFI